MQLISVPTEDNIIFEHYFKTVWFMDCDYEWQKYYEQQKIIEDVMEACGYDSMASFMMLSRAHDIIYDRDCEGEQ